MWEMIAQGEDISEAPDYEHLVPEGSRAKLELQCATPVPTFQVDALRDSLQWAGVDELQMSASGSTINITYRKNPWWLPVIIMAVVALAIIVVLWLFYKEVVNDLPISTINLALVAAGLFGGAILIKAIRSQGG